jgi:hypothetical protein
MFGGIDKGGLDWGKNITKEEFYQEINYQNMSGTLVL